MLLLHNPGVLTCRRLRQLCFFFPPPSPLTSPCTLLLQEENRLRVRYDEEMMETHLDSLAAQEEEEEMHRRWSRHRRRRPASYEEYLQGMHQASAAR